MDLKQLVYDFKVEKRVIDDKEKISFYLNVCTGSNDNLKPELVVESLFGAMGLTYDANAIQIHRRDVYAMAADGKGYVSLGEMGSKID